MIIRLETPADWDEVEQLTRAAFWDEKRIETLGIGCDEHYLVHLFRQDAAFLPQLDFVAEQDGRIVGNILYSLAYIQRPDGSRRTVLIFGPLSVLPAYQKQGGGGALIRHSFDAARALGYDAVIIYGHPEYYPRHGFREAKDFGITTSDGKTFPAHMAIELVPGALSDAAGSFHYAPVFDVDPAAAREYDKRFSS